MVTAPPPAAPAAVVPEAGTRGGASRSPTPRTSQSSETPKQVAIRAKNWMLGLFSPFIWRRMVSWKQPVRP